MSMIFSGICTEQPANFQPAAALPSNIATIIQVLKLVVILGNIKLIISMKINNFSGLLGAKLKIFLAGLCPLQTLDGLKVTYKVSCLCKNGRSLKYLEQSLPGLDKDFLLSTSPFLRVDQGPSILLSFVNPEVFQRLAHIMQPC